MKIFFKYQLLIILSALSTSMAAPPFDIFPLAWFSLIPAFFMIEGIRSNKLSFFAGWEIGILINMHAFYWLNHTIVIFGRLHPIVAFLLYFLLSAWQGLRYGVFFYLYKRFKLKKRVFWLVPTLFAAVEFTIPMLFNWILGNTQYKFLHFIQIVDIFGISFLTFLMVMFSYGLYLMIDRYLLDKSIYYKPFMISIIVLFFVLIYGHFSLSYHNKKNRDSKKITIGMVQANIGIFEKRDRKKRKENIYKFFEQSIKAQKDGAEIIVWPESSIVFPFEQHRKSIKNMAAPYLDVPLIFGGVTFNRETKKWYNSAVFIDENENVIDIYNKHYLLAFGEYIPFSDYFPSLNKMFPEVGNLSKGEKIKVFKYDKKEVIFGIMVCYEDIIESFSNRITKNKPNILLNLTNDGWFGKSSEPDLHKMISIFRTIENRVYLLRTTNTGRTVIISSTGKIIEEIPMFKEGYLVGEIPILKNSTIYQMVGWGTPYLFWFIILIYMIQKKWFQKNKKS